MELSKKLLIALVFCLAISEFAQASLRFRHQRTHKAQNKKLKSLVKSKNGGGFCDNHCYAVFIYPSTLPIYINKAEIPLEDDNSCVEDRFQQAGVSLKLANSVKVRYPDIFKGIYPGRPYESGENFEILKAQYNEYMKDIHLLYKTSDIVNIAKCYFGGTKEPEDPCSFTKACGYSFGGASCVKYEGHCHSTCSACCFLNPEADTITETEEIEVQAPAIDQDIDIIEEPVNVQPEEIEVIDPETGLNLNNVRKNKKKSMASRRVHHHSRKPRKVALAHKKFHSKRKQDGAAAAGDAKQAVGAAAGAATGAATQAANAGATAVANAAGAQPAQKNEASGVQKDAENVVGAKDTSVVGGGDPPGTAPQENHEKIATKEEVEEKAAFEPLHGLSFRADTHFIGTKNYFDKCEVVQHTQDCRDKKCGHAADIVKNNELGVVKSLNEEKADILQKRKRHNKNTKRRRN